MRIEIAGAQITDAVVDVLDTLQNQTDITTLYLSRDFRRSYPHRNS